MNGMEMESITFEFFPASKYFTESVSYLLKKDLKFLKSDFSQMIWKICDQTEMGIFVGTSDDAQEQNKKNLKIEGNLKIN